MSTLSLFDLNQDKASKNQASNTSAGLMSPQDKAKLDTIEQGANKYIHPISHAASMITGLSTVATTGNYTDLNNKPTIPTIPTSLPANGGNADTVDGKHAEDFATSTHEHSGATTTTAGFMSAADKTKLNGIAANANNYSHPATHPASMITTDSTHRFVTDTEKTTWNNKLNTSSYTAADVLAKIKTVDGIGSGLDAELFAGKSSTQYLSKSANDSTPNPLISTFGSDSAKASLIANWPQLNYIGFGSDGNNAIKIGVVNSTAGDWKDQNVDLYVNNALVWTNQNDGTGSSMDADLLDNFHANDINGTPLNGYFATTNYALIGTLPVQNSGTYDKLLVEIVGGTYFSTTTNRDWVVFANRGGFKWSYNKQGESDGRNLFKIIAYQKPDGSVNIYLAASGYYAAIVSAKALFLGGTQSTIKIGNWSTTIPTGTIVFDSSTASTNALDTSMIVTTTANGFMSKEDKAKLNNLSSYEHPATHPASMITGLSTVATTGDYTNLINKPTTLPANGGNADKVDGKEAGGTLLTTEKTNLVTAINELFTSASNGKSSIATAITGKGVTASSSDSFSTLATKIGQIPTGVQIHTYTPTTTTRLLSLYDSDPDYNDFIPRTFSWTITNVPFTVTKVLTHLKLRRRYRIGGTVNNVEENKTIVTKGLGIDDSSDIFLDAGTGSNMDYYIYITSFSQSGSTVTINYYISSWGCNGSSSYSAFAIIDGLKAVLFS